MFRNLSCLAVVILLVSGVRLYASQVNYSVSPYERHVSEVSDLDLKSSAMRSPMSPSDFAGNLKVYIVEPESRWLDYWSEPYHFGFIGYALDLDFSLTGTTPFDTSWQWTSLTFSGITQGNIMAIAVVYEQDGQSSYAHPPNGNPFTAYYVAATAAATHGNPGSNVSEGNYTHTEFIEEGTGSWCVYCPYTVYSLDTLYHDLNGLGQIPFYYAAMVEDKYSVAHDRMVDQMNIWAYPTSYFGGGYAVLAGGYGYEEPYRTLLDSAARREVTPLNLDITVEYVNGNTLNLTLSVSAEAGGICGDADGSGGIDLDDAIFLINYIFGGGPEPVPYEFGDEDCSGGIDLDDVVYIIYYMYGGGPVPCSSCP